MRKISSLSSDQLAKLGVTSVNGLIHFGGKPILDDEYSAAEGIPVLYVVRVKNTSVIVNEATTYWQFVTGLDICDSKELMWLGGGRIKDSCLQLPEAFYKDFEHLCYVLDNLFAETAGKEWAICLEDENIEI